MHVHTPVFLAEVLSYLNVKPGGRYLDATADGGGHASAIFRAAKPGGQILLLEWDRDLYQVLRERFAREFPGERSYVIRQANYRDLDRIARATGFDSLDGIVFDLGASSYHFDRSGRGFSFQRDELLDMRYSDDAGKTAAEILAQSTVDEIEELLGTLSGERYARQIAHAVVAERRRHLFRTTGDLVRCISSAIPLRARKGRIHFATRTFQALRIAVNHEFENLAFGLAAAAGVLTGGGRIAVISFHSGEDRITKNFFKQSEYRASFAAVTGKPLLPSRREVLGNPRARSARLRVFEKVT